MRTRLMLGLIVAVACHRPTYLPPATLTQKAPLCGAGAIAARETDKGPTYFACQVHRVAEPPAVRPLEYPAILGTVGLSGDVHIQFVIDERGRVDPTTIKPLKSTHDLFTSAARRSLTQWNARPAERGGRPVRQLTTHAFCFRAVAPGASAACAKDLAQYAVPAMTIACSDPGSIVCVGRTHSTGESVCETVPAFPVPKSRCT